MSERRWASWLWLSVGFLGACGGGGGGGDSGAPAPSPPAGFVLSSSLPADAATAVAGTSIIELQFSANVSAATVTPQSVQLSTRDGEVGATLLSSGRTVRVLPARRLAPNELHTLRLATTLTDTSGNPLHQTTQMRFTTGGASWQLAQFARTGDCITGLGGAALLDDGTLLLSCFSSVAPDTSVQRRDPTGQWQAALPAPTTTIARPTVRKISGQRAIASWFESGRTSRLARVYDTASGWGPLLAPPQPAGQPPAFDDFDTFGIDNLLVRTRAWQQSEAPVGTTVAGESVYELISATTGQVVAAVRSELGRVGHPGVGCQFPDGSRLYVFGTRQRLAAPGNLFDWRLYATLHTIAGGWSTPVLLDAFTATDATTRPVCADNGVARVFWNNQAASISRYIDLNGAQGWQTLQNLSSTNQLVRASVVTSASGEDGSALISWSDFRLDPNGSVREGTVPETRYARVPRLVELAPSGASWVPLLGLPLYEPGTTHDTGVVHAAFNPATRRYVLIGSGGPTGTSRRFFTDYSRGEGWSTPWTPLSAAGVSGFQPERVLFNASGQGVALGLIQGQTYISEWR